MEQETLDQGLAASELSDERIAEMIALAQRLRASDAALDDAALEAVSEATGAPIEYVRVAVRSLPEQSQEEQKNQPLIGRIRESFALIDPRIRRFVGAAIFGIGTGLFGFFSSVVLRGAGTELFYSIGILFAIAGLVYASLDRKRTNAAIAGALMAGVAYFLYQILSVTLGWFTPILTEEVPAILLLVYVALGGIGGTVIHAIRSRLGEKMGWTDASSNRVALVKQLMEIQDQLKEEEQTAAFLSLDIVGSTAMKKSNDPLAIEYTFGEYHSYVETLAARHGGRIHSTAGDGVLVVFESPSQSFDAGRAMLGGLVEFNAFRNRTTAPIRLRAGLHYGRVGAPGRDAASVDFSDVIDIASHLQKETEPNTMAVSDAVSVYCKGGPDGVGTEKLDVQGVRARCWRPRLVELTPKPA